MAEIRYLIYKLFNPLLATLASDQKFGKWAGDPLIYFAKRRSNHETGNTLTWLNEEILVRLLPVLCMTSASEQIQEIGSLTDSRAGKDDIWR